MTAHVPGCCDDAGWRLDADGAPREPAEACKIHPRNRTPPKKSTGTPTPGNTGDPRQGNKDKFAWFYEMLADTEVSNAAKVVAAGCVMKMAGRKGYFKATRKAIANLCGMSPATVRRGLDDLMARRYLQVEIGEGSGAANTYHLILPAQRLAQWLTEETRHRNAIARDEDQIRKWLFAEKRYLDGQIESQFRVAVFNASIARGADAQRAAQIGDWIVAKYRENGLELDIERGLATVANSKDEVFTPPTPEAETEPGGESDADQKRAAPGSPMSRPRLTADAPTSANGQTHKSFKDSERPVKVFQDLESEPTPENALTRVSGPVPKNAGACRLCGPDGMFRDSDGEPVVMLGDDHKTIDGFIEYPVVCQHSMAANLEEIRRLEREADPKDDLGLCRTGWPEIDRHYGFDDDETYYNP